MNNNNHDVEPLSSAKPAAKETLPFDEMLPFDEHVEEVSENGKRVQRKGVYLLPNLFTTAALFSGFYAIIASINGQFDDAGVAIIIAMIFDGLDGRVARLTNTQSAFGVEYDSLSDMVSFGVAPALVMFSWALAPLGKIGWAVAFLYAACAALRLARFNTQVGVADNRFFTGLASPAAAGLIATMVWLGADMGYAPGGFSIQYEFLCAFVTAVAGVLMVTNIRYYSFKGFDLKGRVPFIVILVIALLFAIVLIDPPSVLLLIAVTYALSGFVATFIEKKKERASK